MLSLGDETDIANVIIAPDVFDRGGVVTRSRFLSIEGPLQNQDGVIHVRAQLLSPLNIAGAEIGSQDFH